MMSYCMPLKVTLVTVPVELPLLHGDDVDVLGADDDVDRLSFGSKAAVDDRGTRGRYMLHHAVADHRAPSRMLVSPMKSATKAFFGSL